MRVWRPVAIAVLVVLVLGAAGVVADGTTQWPDGFTPPRAGSTSAP
jgi:hypothetical protein